MRIHFANSLILFLKAGVLPLGSQAQHIHGDGRACNGGDVGMIIGGRHFGNIATFYVERMTLVQNQRIFTLDGAPVHEP